jgi:hypothetical protein
MDKPITQLHGQMTAWTILAALADAAVAAMFLILGFKRQQWTLMGAGIALIVAMVVLVAATFRHSENWMSGGFLLGLVACTASFLLMWTRAKPGT